MVIGERKPVPGGLEEWFAGFQGPVRLCRGDAPKSVKTKQKRVRLTGAQKDELPKCTTCNRNIISQGSSTACWRAREQDMCVTCYKASRPSREGLKQKAIKKYGLCIVCKDRAIAGGKSSTAGHAREKEMCVDCYTGGRRRGK